jgi:hypothetical protein
MGVIYDSIIFFVDAENYNNENFLNYIIMLITRTQNGITREAQKFIPWTCVKARKQQHHIFPAISQYFTALFHFNLIAVIRQLLK